MTYPIAVLIGVVVGIATGYLAEHAPVRPLLQSTGAAVVGLLLASVVAAATWLLRPPADAQVLAVSFGVTEAFLIGGGVALGAAALHAALGRAGGAVHPVITSHRGTILALVGALYGALASV